MAERTGPLTGRRVVLTRAAERSEEDAAGLAALGAAVEVVPVIGIVPPEDGGAALTAALADLGRYDWVVVTSANAAERVAAAIGAAPRRPQVAAVGSRTAEALAAGGVPTDLVPERFTAEALVEAFGSGPGRVLFPAAAGARATVPDGLRTLGWEVDVVVAYRTEPVRPPALAAARGADAVVFASPSAVRAYLAATAGRAEPELAVVIGPVTAAAAEAGGFRVVAAEPHTMPGVVATLLALLGHEAGAGR